MYVKMAKDINNDARKLMAAYAVITIAHTAETGGTFAVGDVVTSNNANPGRGILLDDTGNVATIAVLSGDFANGNVITAVQSAATVTGTANAAPTLGIGLRIVDTGTYYTDNQRKFGKSDIVLTQGFAPSDITVTTAAVYSEGQGTRLLEQVPILERTGDNLSSGSSEFASNQLPIAGATYQTYVLRVTKTIIPSGMSNLAGNNSYTLIVRANTAGASYAAFNTAITAL